MTTMRKLYIATVFGVGGLIVALTIWSMVAS